MPVQYLTSEHAEMLELILPEDLNYYIEQTSIVQIGGAPKPIEYNIVIYGEFSRLTTHITAEQFAEIRDVPAYMKSVVDRAIAHIYPREVQDD